MGTQDEIRNTVHSSTLKVLTKPLQVMLKHINRKLLAKHLTLPGSWNPQTTALGFALRKHLWKKFISCCVDCNNRQ